MAKLRYKRIRAGRLVRECLYDSPLPTDTPRQRMEKSRCSTAARQRLNDRYSWQKLMMALAANFGDADLVVTLTYDDGKLPRNREEARKYIKRFVASLRAVRREAGTDLRYIYVTEDKHGDGRLHHHIVLNATGADYAAIRQAWEFGENVEISPLDTFGYEELAKYLTKEPREYGHTDVGARTWVPSKGLAKPEVEPTVWVPGSMRLDPPANAHVLFREGHENEYGRFSYIVYLLPEPPRATRSRPSGGRPVKIE